MLQKAFVQVYTGNGKGKTTAALGLAMRAAGRGLKTCFVQFMKGREYGEHVFLERIPEIDIFPVGTTDCIRKEDVKVEHIAAASKGLEKGREVMNNGEYDILVLDEINVAVWFGLINESDVLELIDKRPEGLELILTGRYATQSVIEQADLVTEMKNVRHMYDLGIDARQGIEY
jgi:cob(I)alamin adenosyltransferase